MSEPASIDLHRRALAAADAVTGRRLTRRAGFAALAAVALFGVDVTSSRASGETTAAVAPDGGPTFGAHSKGCFAWGPPAPPRFLGEVAA